MSITSLESAKEIQSGIITNVRKKAPVSNPSNFSIYAEIRSKDGELLVSATLDFCVERMEDAVNYLFENENS